MLRNPSLKYVLFFAGICLSSISISAQEKPEVKLKNTIESVIDVLYQPDRSITVETKRNQVLELLNQSFSFDILIRRTLGRNWQKLNAEQQNQIIRLATDLMIHAYTREFQRGVRPTVVFKKPVELSKNKLEIASVLSLPDKKINLSYRLARLESGWQVYDLIVEGVSLVSNYRKQFDAHFLKKDGDALIQKLEEKLAAL
ncbi:MAG: ABC transporter substrate-binding protein [Verrucomicrobia bacterium]|nr:ABC transporter substrate-binding protein [Verrucomicrobiota bacterium]